MVLVLRQVTRHLQCDAAFECVSREFGLPFEAAFILFLAVDPICDMLRTLVLVIGNNAAVSLICPRPLKI